MCCFMLSYFIGCLSLLYLNGTKRSSKIEHSLVSNQINLLFIIYKSILLVLNMISLHSYSIYFIFIKGYRKKRNRHVKLMLEKAKQRILHLKLHKLSVN